MKSRLVARALGICALIFSNPLHADVNVLIVGSPKDSGEMHPSNGSWSAQKAPMARNLPACSLWAQIHKEYQVLSPMRDKAKGKGVFAI